VLPSLTALTEPLTNGTASPSLDDVAREKLAALERRQLRRRLAVTERTTATRAVRGESELVSFSCNDYLGLSRHPDVIAASVAATQRHGAGAGSSRLVNGNHPLYEELERKLAALKGSEDAVVFGSGYLTNLGVIPALVGAADLILVDELCHSCLLAGAELARSRVLEFRHNDVSHLEELLAAERSRHRHCLVLTDGVFSMEGDLAPLPALAALAAEHDAWLMSDDAHGLGVVGDGRGSSFVSTPPAAVPLQMGTLSKAVGSYGGYLCASHAVAELVRNRARSFVYSTGLPPGAVAAASRALEIIATDRELVRRPLALARRFTAAVGLPAAQSPIVSLRQGGAEQALAASDALRAAGFLVVAIRPPTVPPGTSRLRVTFSAEHTYAQVDALATAVRSLLAAA
jgi:8-amino-7-oxononanoate synthase